MIKARVFSNQCEVMNRIGEKKMARRKIVAGNWKMNKTPSEAVAWWKS